MSDLNFKRFIKLMAFIATILVAVALVLQLILAQFDVSVNVVNALRIVGECIAYFVVIITAFGYVQNKRNPVWAIIYAISVTVIIVLLFLR